MDPPRLFVPASSLPNPDLVRQGAAARRLAAMGLEVSGEQLTGGERVLRRLYGGSFVTFRDAFGEEVTLDRVLSWVREVPAEAILATCSVLSRYASAGSHRERSQRPLLEWAMSGLIAPWILEMLAGGDEAPRQFVFHHEQLLLAAKLAIIHGADGPAEPANIEQRHTVGRILLSVNDLILSAGRDESPESDAILGLVVRSLSVNGSEEPRYQIANAYDMFVERAASAAQIDGFFRDEFGISILEFMAFGLFCSIPSVPYAVPDPPRLDVADMLSSAEFVPTRMRLHPEWLPTLDQVVGSREWFRSVLDDKVAASTFFPFQQRPYYRTMSGAIFPISHRFVLDRIGNGMFWMLHDARRAMGGNEVQTFMGTVGNVCVEPHCVDALRAATPAVSGLRFINGSIVPEYTSPGLGRVRGADAYIVDGARLIVIEITASGIPVNVLLSGDGAAFRSEFEKKMVVEITPSGRRKPGKLGQLDRVVRDLLAGHLQLPGVAADDINIIYPVMLGYQPLPQLANIGAVIRQLFETHALFDFSSSAIAVAPVRIITLEELDIVGGDLAAGRIRLADVLQLWIDDGLGHDSGLKNHLLRRGYVEADNPRIHATYDRWGKASRDLLIKTGLVTPASAPPDQELGA